ncbi:MAG: sigma-70 family RNA polymerase sigma factor, partial [Chloroflexi bacterium]|nr:sigma-70 family RNA polymerase sigma factor [Chloroflexota bacterium]
MSESELVTRAQAGDAQAFTQLVELYQTPIYNLCYRMLGEAREAEDAAQETFLRAYAQLYRYQLGRSFKTWLFAIASHHCIDHLRKRRLLWLSLDEPLEPHPALNEPTPGPEDSSLRREQTQLVETMLKKLSPEDRSAVILRYWNDLSYEEIADATNSSVSAVKSRLHRARASLATLLKNESRGAAMTAPHPELAL